VSYPFILELVFTLMGFLSPASLPRPRMSNQALVFGVDVREDDAGGELADQIGCRRERLAEKGEEVTDGYTLCVSKLVLGFVVEVAPPGCGLHWWATSTCEYCVNAFP